MPPQLRQGTLPFKRRSAGRAVRTPERMTEAETDFELSRHQYDFLNTTVRYSRFTVECPRCHAHHQVRNNQGTGQDRGIADRLVYHPSWWHALLPATLWLSVELKGSHTPFSSPEQRALHEAGHTVLARDGATALQAARDVDGFFSYVEQLEAAAIALLDSLRPQSVPTWRECARQLRTVLSLAGEREARAALSGG